MSEEILEKRQYTMTDMEIVKRLMTYTIPFIKDFILVLVLMVITVAISVLEPVLIGVSIDSLTGDNIDLDRLIVLLSIFVTVILVGALFNYLQPILLLLTGQKIIYNIREEIFTQIGRASCRERVFRAV